MAVEIGLPDAEARNRLLDLYSRDVRLELTDEQRSAVLERTEGATAFFSTSRFGGRTRVAARTFALVSVSSVHVARAVDDLLDRT